ncbi:MAG TPA: hypothetical protein VFN25_01240 [Dokdonella sp.]|uniref:hypothetical protein n=1 Tax=Dokdonella sp. TaxID=2291710 RepID=UPI002D7E1554|nr:hypothetical protein [Dokdonella sp.]HET9031506.1 hypothetical protein [Dokdonella sp.]
MSQINRFLILVSMLLVMAAAPAIAAKHSKVIIVNQSHWAIHELYFSPTDESEWGDDQLGDDVIESGEKFTLNGVPCDKWDVRVVDEDGDECVIENVGLCADTDKWVIKDSDLLACQAATD